MDIQKRVDQLLMVGWQEEKNMGWVIYKLGKFIGVDFESDIKPVLLDKGIKRIFNSDFCIGYKTPVRAHIDRHCKELSNKLWNGAMPILESSNLDRYKWNMKSNPKAKVMASRRSRNKKIVIYRAKVSENEKDRDIISRGKRGWNTVS